MDDHPLRDTTLLWSDEAEQSVIGAVLLDPLCIHTFELRVEDFFSHENRHAWEALVSLVFDKKVAVDAITLADEIKVLGYSTPDITKVVALAALVPTSANVGYYARIVRRYAVKRSMLSTLQKQMGKVERAEPDEIADAVNAAQREVVAISEVKSLILPAGTVARELLVKMDEKDGLLEPFVPIGLERVDRRVGGLLVGHTTVIAARPSMGKSAIARAMADNQAAGGTPVGLITVEDKRQRVILGIACKRAMVDIRRAMLNQINTKERERLALELARIEGRPLYICDERPLSPEQVCHRLRRMKAEHGIQVAYVDYWNRLALPHARQGGTRREEANDFVNLMADTADQLGIALVVVAQLNRDAEKEQRRPRLSDLKETGGLEEIAESVILLHRESFYKPEAKPIEFKSAVNELECIVGKWKTAPPFRTVLYWIGRCLSVTDEEPEDPDAPAAQRQQSFKS